jgi:uncharacterized protein YkwD
VHCRKRHLRAVHRTAKKPHTHSHRLTGHRRPAGSANPQPARRPSPAHGAGACQDGGLEPNAQNLDRIRAAVMCLVNQERTSRGEGELQPNERLEQAAQSHTESMASGDYFEHVGPGGDTPLTRMRASGYIYSSQIGFEVGENLAWGTLWEASPRTIVASWMASQGHRENILNPRFRDTAVGVSPHAPSSKSHGQPGALYTQDFGVIVTG